MKRLLKEGLRILSLLSLFILIIFLSGCSSSPNFATLNYPAVLVAEGRMLIHFNLSRDTLILNGFLKEIYTGDLANFLNRTDRVSISLEDLKGESGFSILAEGDYPKTISNLMLSGDDEWIKHKDNYVWWEHKTSGMFASVPMKSVFLLSNSDLDEELRFLEFGKRNYLPEIVRTEMDRSAVVLYSAMPGEKLYGSLNIPTEKMNVDELMFVIRKEGDLYRISGILEFSGNSQARSFSTGFKLALIMKLRDTGKKAIMKVIQESRINSENSSVIVEDLYLSPDEMIELLN